MDEGSKIGIFSFSDDLTIDIRIINLLIVPEYFSEDGEGVQPCRCRCWHSFCLDEPVLHTPNTLVTYGYLFEILSTVLNYIGGGGVFNSAPPRLQRHPL